MHSPQRFKVQWRYQVKICFFMTREISTPLQARTLFCLESPSSSSTFNICLDAFKSLSLFLSYTQHITCTRQQGTTIHFQEQRDAETVFPMVQLLIFQVYQVKIFFSSIWRHQIPLHAKAAHSV